jgi:hypothetical protein
VHSAPREVLQVGTYDWQAIPKSRLLQIWAQDDQRKTHSLDGFPYRVGTLAGKGWTEKDNQIAGRVVLVCLYFIDWRFIDRLRPWQSQGVPEEIRDLGVRRDDPASRVKRFLFRLDEPARSAKLGQGLAVRIEPSGIIQMPFEDFCWKASHQDVK